jgi:hypothetical protein
VKNLRPASAAGRRQVRGYLLPPLELGLFGVVELPLLLPLVPPLVLPLGLLGEELLPDAADGLFEVLLEPPAADWSRWQPASASASDAAMIISTFMDPPVKGHPVFSKHRAGATMHTP